jgi:uncharacterized protein
MWLLVKYLVVALVVGVVAWLLLRSREGDGPRQQRNKPEGQGPQPVLQCRHCGMHVPRSEAMVDARGAFCSEAHRLAGPRSH